ncbi:hypothetical protein B0J13DRAFT_623271 [Dactylonectria estremocensis]|uniref:Uncharacterized protein n=1 Tax=Dactylonectria estremocensis TaxID=1079267 RepID=A0A9P9ESF3_9HYPO|nr:hypothetical protein B0J13DRAFT_623271 [Dactylonectria estremocensis]
MSTHHNKTITISGAGSGVGFATAKYLYEQGARIQIADIKEELLRNELPAIADEKGDSNGIIASLLNVSLSKQAEGWIEKTTSHLELSMLSKDEWNFVLDVNINGVFYALSAQIQALQRLGKEGAS